MAAVRPIVCVLIAVVAAVACGAVIAQGGLDEEPDEELLHLVERLLSAPSRDPEAYRPDPAAPYPSERRFAFDGVLRHPPEDLLKAVAIVLDRYAMPPDEAARAAWKHGTMARLVILFEYYPLVARRAEDAQQLVGRMVDGSTPPVLREFLIRQLAPGLEVPSVFGRYLQAMLADDAKLDEKLSNMVKNPTELPTVQLASLEALGRRMAAAYEALIASDPLVRERAQRGDALPDIRTIKDVPDSVSLSRRTHLLLSKRGETTARIAAMLQDVAEDPARDAPLRERARVLAVEMLESYPMGHTQTQISK